MHSIVGVATEADARPFAPGGPSRDACTFMTIGTFAYLAGIRCVMRRLAATRTRHPLVVMASSSEEADRIRKVLHADMARQRQHLNLSVLAWRRFPCNYRTPFRTGYRLDKLNVLAAPFRRVVWLDADVRGSALSDRLASKGCAMSYECRLFSRRCWCGATSTRCATCRPPCALRQCPTPAAPARGA